uniref:3beta-hydroxysteroid 3-dehydrogenase n=1 Tax=Talaromyces marneffei PM1 TaxID=1077442 RepID=A0A093XTJ7_TALMA
MSIKTPYPTEDEPRLELGPDDKLENHTVVLVTGANSGLGYATCLRLIDEFAKDPANNHKQLTLIFTTRRPPAQVQTLKNDMRKHALILGPQVSSRINILAETVDLLNLPSVRALSIRLNRNFPKLDSIILNAGIGGWSGIDWPSAIWNVCTDLLHSATWPTFKLGYVGMVVPNQTHQPDEKPLGSVFCANVFGHYMLAHNVMPLLRRSTNPGRVIWVSSIEAREESFNVDDIQGLKTNISYESSKTLTDILALTSDLPSTKPWVQKFLSADDDDKTEGPEPVNYLGHPGVCGTSIVPLILPLYWSFVAAMYIARWLGSPWHTIFPYSGANSLVWLALSPKSTLDAAEKPYRDRAGGHAKWGSSTDFWGRLIVASTETDGWGHGGVVDGVHVVEADRVRRRRRGMKVASAEDRVRFEELGRECWRRMEELRVEWDGLLDSLESSSE